MSPEKYWDDAQVGDECISPEYEVTGERVMAYADLTGDHTPVHTDDDLLVYERSSNGERRLVALNLSHSPRTLAWKEPRTRIVLSTHLDREGEVGDQLELRADEGVVMGQRSS